MSIVVLTRKRKQGTGCPSRVVPIGTSRSQNWWNGVWQNPITITTTVADGINHVTWDNVHPGYSTKYRGKKLPSNSSLDQGGDFSSFKIYEGSVVRGIGSYVAPIVGMTNGMEYNGGFVAVQWPSTPFSTTDLQNVGTSGKFTGEFGVATSDGPSAWNRFKPKLYTADLGQFVGEIHQVLPMLRTTAKIFSDIWRSVNSKRGLTCMGKTASNHWLNAQFGWAPFLGDMSKLVKSYSFVQRKLQNCISMNGQFTRRGGLVSSNEGNPVSSLVAESAGQHTQYMMPSTQLNIQPLVVVPPGNGKASWSKITYEESYRTWFSGCFRYWVPSFHSPDTAMNLLSNYLRMYGIRITPELIWNLTPWSWLADWVGNVGDNIANYTTATQDNLTAKYAYIMKETRGVLTNTTWVNFRPPYGPRFFEWTREFTVKTRRHASPFGFTVDWPQFSAFQLSILTALGFPRLVRTRGPAVG